MVRGERADRPQAKALWKVVFIDLAMVGIVVGAFAVVLGRWLEHREQMVTAVSVWFV